MARLAALAVALLVCAGAAEARVSRALHADEVILHEQRERAAPLAPGRSGALVVVPGRSRSSAPGAARFSVEVEGGLRIDAGRFAEHVTRILRDHRSWSVPVRRVSSEPVAFSVALASPSMTDRLCAPLPTNGIFSCAQGGRAVLNVARWRGGADSYGRALARYRIYLVNHEVGHLLGRGHVACPAAGAPAPVMMQQTKGVAPCAANPWPLRWER